MNEANTPPATGPEQAPPVQEAGKETAKQPAERQTAAQESVGQQAPPPGSGISTDDAQAAVQAATSDQPAAPAGQPAKPTPVKNSPTADLQAGDGDLIEKQWVERAKAIVASTQEDPHKQKSEMSKAKADYIKKRFNKVIKTE